MPKYTVLSLLVSIFISVQSIGLDIGDKATQIVGRDISNSLFALSRMDAKPKVLNFFWVGCLPCKKEIPLLAEKEKKYPHISFVSIHAEINMDTETNYNIEDIQKYVASLQGHPKQVVLGSDRLKQEYGIEGFPVSFLLSADNVVEEVLFGFNEGTMKQLADWVSQQ